MRISTLCYIENNGAWLMLHRIKKSHDVNHGKWIGVGGKLEEGESPAACVVREIREETGLTVTALKARGILTFLYPGQDAEYIFVFTAQSPSRAVTACNEGDLAWVPLEQVMDLELWEGDRSFLPLLLEERPFFSFKLTYDQAGNLLQAIEDPLR